jgi:predicted nucleic acid-binding protein
VKYWDTSAVVPLLVDEPTHERLVEVLEADPALVVWWSTPVECMSALARRERSGDLLVSEATTAIERLRVLEQSWIEIAPSAIVRRLALRLLRTHPLRSSDSLQLAAALVAADDNPAALEFVCLDERLSHAAQREGFQIVA